MVKNTAVLDTFQCRLTGKKVMGTNTEFTVISKKYLILFRQSCRRRLGPGKKTAQTHNVG